MKIYIWCIVLTLGFILLPHNNLAAGTKIIEKHFPVKSTQRIKIGREFGSSKVSIKSWDRKEVYIKLNVTFSSSDHEYERKVINSYDITSTRDDNTFSISTRRTGNESTWSSFLGIRFRIAFHESTDMDGEIFVPRDNPFSSECSYSSISLEDMTGEIEFLGSNNNITIKNCTFTKSIANNYGRMKIENCSGDLYFKSRNANIEVNDLKGSLWIDGDYSNITLNNINRKTTINSKSAKLVINNINGDLTVKADYSTIQIDNVSGFANVQGLSGSITAKKLGGIRIDSKYSDVEVYSVNGKAAKDVSIKDLSGGLHLEDITGNLKIEAPYCNVKLKNIRGEVDISGRSASVQAEKINGNWNSKTEYMKLTIRDLSAKVLKIINKSEVVDVEFQSVPAEIDIKNEYGNVKVTLPGGFTGEVDLGTAYGNIQCNLPVKIKNMAGSSLASGKLGNGHGRINIETMSANISLNEKLY